MTKRSIRFLARVLAGVTGPNTALTAAILAVCVVLIAPPTTSSAASVALVVSSSSDRSSAIPLEGSFLTGDVYIFAQADVAVTQARFLVNGDWYSVDRLAPYDLAGGSATVANPTAIEGLGNGSHSVKVQMISGGSIVAVSTANFTVGPPPPVGVELLVSPNPDRSGAVTLDQTDQSGDIYVFGSVSSGVDKARFTVDGSWYSVDMSAPFDLEGGTTTVANPFAVDDLGNGSHSIKIQLISGGSVVAASTATFTVGPEPPDGVQLLVSANADRSGAVTLDQTDQDGDIYVFASVSSGIDKARFTVDGSWYSVDQSGPFDLEGGTTSAANPLAVETLGSGSHSLRVQLIVDGTVVASDSAEFTVSGSGPITVIPPDAVRISPGENIQAVIKGHPTGTTFGLLAGVHRLQTIKPRDGDTFIGEAGTILNGSKVLTFSRSNGYWIASNQTQQGAVRGVCLIEGSVEYQGCKRPEDVFIDGEPLWQVMSRSAVVPGSWYFDYSNNTIYLTDDPRGHVVETSVSSTAFRGTASNVTVRGLTIEKYASPTQIGAVDASDGLGWLIEGNEIRLNHSFGIAVGTRTVSRDNVVHHNGQLGIGGSGNNAVVENNELFENNFAGYRPGWEAGGMKFTNTKNLVVRNNYVHNNDGMGIWTDIDNIDTLIEGNRVEWNSRRGISHEISYDAVIRYNTVGRNGIGKDGWLWGAQIVVQNSPNVEVYGNTVEVDASGGDGIAIINQNRGTGSYGARVSKNIWVHDNVVTYLGSVGHSGIADDTGGSACRSSWNNRFDRNTYRVGSLSTNHWSWCGYLSWSKLRSAGQETNGTVVLR